MIASFSVIWIKYTCDCEQVMDSVIKSSGRSETVRKKENQQKAKRVWNV